MGGPANSFRTEIITDKIEMARDEFEKEIADKIHNESNLFNCDTKKSINDPKTNDMHKFQEGNIGNDDVVGFVDPKKVSFEDDEVVVVGDNLNQYTEISNDDYTCLTTSTSSSTKIDPSEQNI